jgi:hypothetical protein
MQVSCVCMCERANERERERINLIYRGNDKIDTLIYTKWSKSTLFVASDRDGRVTVWKTFELFVQHRAVSVQIG